MIVSKPNHKKLELHLFIRIATTIKIFDFIIVVVNIQNSVEHWQELASRVNPIVQISVANLGY